MPAAAFPVPTFGVRAKPLDRPLYLALVPNLKMGAPAMRVSMSSEAERHLSIGATNLPDTSFSAPSIIEVAVMSLIEEEIGAADRALALSATGLDDPDFVAPTDVARASARRFVELFALRSIAMQARLPMPEWQATASGGVDLHWEMASTDVLLAIPPEGGAVARYFGDTPDGFVTKATAPIDACVDALVPWLARFR